MALVRSPMKTRSQAAAASSGEGSCSLEQGADLERETLMAKLREATEEIRLLREERRREPSLEQEEHAERRSATTGQSSFSNVALNFKPDIFDGTASLSEYLAQFEIVARANKWKSTEKAVALAANLRGEARSVLEILGGNFEYSEIKSKLELRFGERNNFQNCYSLFINRKLRLGEEFASFGCDLERLARLIYPECTFEIRDRIACAQFINGIPDCFIKQNLMLENITSLRETVERAKTLKVIFENNNKGKFSFQNKFESGKGNGKNLSQNFFKPRYEKEGSPQGRNNSRNNKECWSCGGKGHLRAECPSYYKTGN